MNIRCPKPRRGLRPGVTLVELTVMIVVLTLFLSLFFIGFKAWKQGADRANCVQNIRQVQVAVRGYSNLFALGPGDNTRKVSHKVVLEKELIGPGKYVMPPPECPGTGKYTCGGNDIPYLGELYMTCSLAETDGHVPNNYRGW